MARLQGKVAIVTGAARGIGAACAVALAREGAAVIVADVLDATGEATAQGIRDAGGKAIFLRLDVTDAEGWAHVVAEAMRQFGGVDCLINNAAIDIGTTIETATIAEFRRILDINLFGAFHGMQAVIPVMKTKGGSIINVASLATRKVAGTTTVYGAAKAALGNLTKTTAVHCAQQGYGIRVNSIHPGPVETEMLLPGGVARPEVAQVMAMIPLGRLGAASDIGNLAVFLASDESNYITATETFVDGGLSAM